MVCEEKYVVTSETFYYEEVIKTCWVIFIAEDFRQALNLMRWNEEGISHM